ncbi:MAG TPA: hypothetical protein VMM57_08335, partial [Bacteroidota bacterium]|nr:hypothetical protein [Bacteroidota bacterium]
PSSMGGGQGSYVGYSIPSKMSTNENGTYAASGQSATGVTITATSAANTTNTIVTVVDSDGHLGSWTYAGDFQ